MSYKKIITFLIIFFIAISIPGVKAQELNITGDTIFVNAEAEIQIQFPTIPGSFNTVPMNAEYSLRSEKKSVIIIARLENSKTAGLLVSEGNRNHHFILVFKKDIDYGYEPNLFKDYGTKQKLADHIKETARRPAVVQPSVNPASTPPVTPEVTVVPDNDKKYLAAINEAKTYLDQKKYAQAKEAYQRALELKPGDLNAGTQLETIRKLELEEGTKKDLENSQNLYNDYIAQGDKAYISNQLTEAGTAYQKALTIKPGDAIATSRLKLVDDKQKTQIKSNELENNYNTAIQAGNAFLQAGDLEGAKAEYTKALGFFKRPFPAEQIKAIDKKIADQAANEKRETQLREEQLKADRLRQEQVERESNYAAAVRSADAFFKAGDYDNAVIDYNKALDFMKNDWPKSQISLIARLRAEEAEKLNTVRREQEKLEREHKYNAAKESADKYFQAGDYDNAKIMYTRAMSIIATSETRDKITAINKIKEERHAQEIAEQQRLAHESEITFRYTTLIKNADAEYDKNNYAKAKQLYTQASNLKPAEEHPKNRLTTIEGAFAKIAADQKARNDSIALAKEINRKYSAALSQGKSSYRKDDLLNAKIFYEQAVNLKPSEEEPKTQLNIIINKLADIARAKAIDDNYELKIASGNNQVIAKEYDSALSSYNEALKLKPSEVYPKTQIKYIQTELADIERRKEIARRQEIERKYAEELTAADDAVTGKRYEQARSLYTHALTLHPENAYARRRLEIINYQIEKMRTDSLNQVAAATEKAPEKSKEKKSRDKANKSQEKPAANHLVFQSNPIPYTRDELKIKYPDIDFLVLPPEQPFNKLASTSLENLKFYDTLVSEKSRLDLVSGDQGVKLIVQGINFEETIAYVKVLIQNNSNTDFLTGAMMLTWTKNTGNHIKLYPNHLYPSPLPVIKPGYEAIVIYVCRTYNVLDADLLTFELIDRFKKVKLAVNIPGTAYNKEWVRAE